MFLFIHIGCWIENTILKTKKQLFNCARNSLANSIINYGRSEYILAEKVHVVFKGCYLRHNKKKGKIRSHQSSLRYI